MKRFVMFAASLVLSVSMAACAVAGASGEYPSTKIRYKMTVEVETPEGIKTGSAVREISMVSRPMLLGESNDTHVKLEKGEAVVVDLGQRGVLFSLLTNPAGTSASHPIWALFNAFPSLCPEGDVSRCGIRYYSALKDTGQVEIKEKDYPMLVRFRDLNDARTVERAIEMEVCLDPESVNSSFCIKKDRFEEFFGQGVRLRSIKVEITEEIPSVGNVEKILPPFQPNANRFSRNDFIVGEK